LKEKIKQDLDILKYIMVLPSL